MHFWKLSQTVLLSVVGLGLALTGQSLFAGTTFLISAQPYPLTNIFCSISSNGIVTPMDQSASSAFGTPEGMAVDPNGNLYVAYSGDAIVKYTSNNSSLFVSGIGAPNLLGFDNAGNLYGNSNDCLIKITTNGTSVYASGMAGMNGFCFDKSGNLFASMPSQIIRIAPNGSSSVVATPATISSNILAILSVALDGQTNIYAEISEYWSGVQYLIFKLDTNGIGTQSFQTGQAGSGMNIVADEKADVIFTSLSHYQVAVEGPFGIVSFNNHVVGALATYVAYTPLNETLPFSAPSIILQPQSQTAGAGSSVSLRAGAFGAAPLSIQWYFNQTNLIAGATNQNLTLTNVNSNEIGQYTMVASNYLGSASSQPATLNVLPTLAINFVPAISLYGGVGFSYNVQYINVIGPTNAPWTTLATVTLTKSPQFYSDYSAIGQPARFYRSIQLP